MHGLRLGFLSLVLDHDLELVLVYASLRANESKHTWMVLDNASLYIYIYIGKGIGGDEPRYSYPCNPPSCWEMLDYTNSTIEYNDAWVNIYHKLV